MQRAWLVIGVSLLLSGCDARKLVPADWSESKSCAASEPDCVFQSAAGTTQQICELTTGQCRQCGKGADSMSSFDLVSGTKECRDGYKKGLICDSTKFECRSCQSINQECAKADPAYPVCNGGVCTACTTNDECVKEGFITCSSGRCRGCSTNTECKDDTKPYCDPGTTACRECKADSECDSQLCDTGKNPAVVEGVGKCAKANSIVWVQNGGCSNGQGTVASPYCSIAEALANPNAKYLQLKTSGMAYTVPSPLNRNLVLLGQGTTFADVILTAFTFSGAGQSLVLRNVTVSDPAQLQSLVKCTAGSVTVFKSKLDRGKRGIDADSSCTKVTVEQTRIEGASGAGIYIAAQTDYRIVNSIVLNTANGSDFTGVILSTSKTGKFSFNTVIGNGKLAVPTIPGGLDCGSTQKLLENSLIFSNSNNPLNKQFVGTACQGKGLVVGSDSSAPQGSSMSSPMLNGDYTLMSGDTACADQVDADPEITVDYFGNPRPKVAGGKADIGFHEVK
ncbi:MAG: NosD domain-containing protein [Polyangia bacterium]